MTLAEPINKVELITKPWGTLTDGAANSAELSFWALLERCWQGRVRFLLCVLRAVASLRENLLSPVETFQGPVCIVN
jgi:hypothetical protein